MGGGRAPPSGALRAVVCSATLAGTTACGDGRFMAPSVPGSATDHNGIALDDVCFYGGGEHHVFVIGDWGGVESDSGGPPMPADDRDWKKEHHRKFMEGIDNNAQMRVADAMRARAPTSRPDFVINVGDSFYWGGLDTDCGTPPTEHVENSQWVSVFEQVYAGDGIDGRQWLGVLGNHDYGGWKFDSAWDQLIGYTWGKDLPGSQDRWMMPAQYYSVKVWYPYTDEQGLQVDFSVDYFFVDSNTFNAHEGGYDSNHNICDPKHNAKNASCGIEGPESLEVCPRWFRKLWKDQMQWLEEVLPKSFADWKIVVTHFPPGHGRKDWKRLSDSFGIDLILTGHEHSQQVWYNHTSNFLAPTAWVVSGGGGGITSSGLPDARGNDDQYGFVDLTLTKSEITVEMISHGGFTRRRVKIHKGGEGDFLPDLPTWKAMAQVEEERKRNASYKAAKEAQLRAHKLSAKLAEVASRQAEANASAAATGKLQQPTAAAASDGDAGPGAGCQKTCELPGGVAAASCRDLIQWLASDWLYRPRGAGQCKAAYIETLKGCPACYGCALSDAGCRDRDVDTTHEAIAGDSVVAATTGHVRHETTELYA